MLTRCPFAIWRGDIPNKTVGGFELPAAGVVFHITGSNYTAADGWFHNPKAQASAQFGICAGGSNSLAPGQLVQWVDLADRAWHAVAANRHWVGVETEGTGGPCNDVQLATFARLYAWLRQPDVFGPNLPLVICDDPNSRGFGWHGMGGSAWGGHDYCPGPERRAQRARIIELAQPTPQPPLVQEDEPMLIVSSKTNNYVTNGQTKHTLHDDAAIQRWLAAGAKDARAILSTDDVDHIPLSDA